MIKRILFAVAPMLLVACSVSADDNLMSMIASMNLEGSQADSSDVMEADHLGQADVDALLSDGDDVSGEEAIAACFRRINYGYRSYGYRSYGYSSFRSYYTPTYRTHCYTPVVHHYRPVTYSYYTPVYSSYWGCW